MAEQKQHKPTPKKLKDSRKEGKVLRAGMISQLFSMVMVLVVSLSLVRYLWFKNQMLLEWSLERSLQDPSVLVWDLLIVVLLLGGVPLAVGSVASVLVQSVVTGVVFEWSILVPKGKRFGQGFGQIMRGLKQSWETLAKLLLFSVVAVWILYRYVGTFSDVLFLDHHQGLSQSAGVLRQVLSILVGTFGVVAFFDFLLRRKEFYRDLSMSDQDIRQEHKTDEGDPLLRSQRKALHQEVLSQELVERVRKAKVIIVKRKDVVQSSFTDS